MDGNDRRSSLSPSLSPRSWPVIVSVPISVPDPPAGRGLGRDREQGPRTRARAQAQNARAPGRRPPSRELGAKPARLRLVLRANRLGQVFAERLQELALVGHFLEPRVRVDPQELREGAIRKVKPAGIERAV